jgi:hypothetical protein
MHVHNFEHITTPITFNLHVERLMTLKGAFEQLNSCSFSKMITVIQCHKGITDTETAILAFRHFMSCIAVT